MSVSFEQRLPALLAAYQTGIARGRQELIGAYELVYRRYVARGFVPPDPGGMVYHPTFALPESRTIVTSYGGRLAGTVTLVGDNFHGLHLETTYRAEVAQLRARRRALAEVTCLAVEPQQGEPKSGAFFALTRFMFQYARWYQYDDLLLAIHPRHVQFYERWFRVYRFGPCRPYQLVQGQPAIACRIDLHAVDEVVPHDVFQWYTEPAIAPFEFCTGPISHRDHVYLSSRASHAPQECRRYAA